MEINVLSFMLIFIRVASMLFAMPLFEVKLIANKFKIGLAFFISLILMYVVHIDMTYMNNIWAIFMGIFHEFMIGFTIGLVARLIFTAIEIAGEIIGFQMGFGIINVIDPQTSSHVPIIGQFQSIIATLVFLSINAHHYFIAAIAQSFKIIPPTKTILSNLLMDNLIRFSSAIFTLAIKIGAPLLLTLLITNIAMNILSKTIPQMNILIVGFPLTIAGGLLMLGISLPFFVYLMEKIFLGLETNITDILILMGR